MGYLAGGAAIIILLLGIGMKHLYEDNQTKSKEIGNLSGRVIGLQGEIKLRDAVAELSAKLAAEHAKETEENQRGYEGRIADLGQELLTSEDRALDSPMAFGDDFAVRLGRVFCRIQAGTDRDSRNACDRASPEAYFPDQSITLTITPDLAEQYAEHCDGFRDGSNDFGEPFCRWSITGFTPEGGYIILSYLERLDGFMLAQGTHIEQVHDLVESLPELTKGQGND